MSLSFKCSLSLISPKVFDLAFAIVVASYSSNKSSIILKASPEVSASFNSISLRLNDSLSWPNSSSLCSMEYFLISRTLSVSLLVDGESLIEEDLLFTVLNDFLIVSSSLDFIYTTIFNQKFCQIQNFHFIIFQIQFTERTWSHQSFRVCIFCLGDS